MADQRLRVLVFGAHPDDCDFTAGGVAALYARQGHQVLFISVTNGDAGHHLVGGAQAGPAPPAPRPAQPARRLVFATICSIFTMASCCPRSKTAAGSSS